jgi:hypothetical protein
MSLPPLELASCGTRAKANMLHDFWTEVVEAEFANDEHAHFIESRGLKQLITEFSRIRFKKVNRRLLVAGNRTAQSASWIQLPIPGITTLLSLTFGYRPDAPWSKIETAGLALQVGNSVPWFLEVGSVEQDDATPDQGEAPTPIEGRPIKVNRHVLEIRQEELRAAEEAAAEGTGEQ